MTMRTLVTILLVASTTDAFTPPTTITSITKSTTSLNHIDTRKRIEAQELGIWQTSCRNEAGEYVPCEAISGHERRAMWETYAPVHGSPDTYGAIGCPGGGDWCYASSYAGAAPMPANKDTKKRASTVAAALAGLGKGVGGATTDGVGVAIKTVGGGGGGGPHAAVAAMPSGKQIGSTGDYFRNLSGFSEPPPPKRYALGSWKKK